MRGLQKLGVVVKTQMEPFVLNGICLKGLSLIVIFILVFLIPDMGRSKFRGNVYWTFTDER